MGGSWLWGIGYGNGIFVAVGIAPPRHINGRGDLDKRHQRRGGLWDVAVEAE